MPWDGRRPLSSEIQESNPSIQRVFPGQACGLFAWMTSLSKANGKRKYVYKRSKTSDGAAVRVSEAREDSYAIELHIRSYEKLRVQVKMSATFSGCSFPHGLRRGQHDSAR